MKSMDRLVAEHDVIERGLALLDKAVRRIEAGESLPDGFAQWAPEFFRQFADTCHHAKEEDLLFPLMQERGVPGDGGPIGVMLQEHDAGRACVGRMREAGAADPFDGDAFAAAAREFVPLLQQHIFKENQVLFPMATRLFSEADDEELNSRFSRVEEERNLAGMQERYDAEVTRWEGELG
ncbi:MAG: hemerythrin [Acidobacteria bacterium]|nr:hemerythrin [Acidobacteriota bacterium]NIM63891.1 hemerythrin [Acidobacteriota bacterium]NIO60160.1 hemerythrin [Acidobacteriota bacterium]NIQ31224.1 hemerythrin [Acidobacteriota bacterium]NIQ86361.1 hemerythrin [Acidobacteriota bacterium]